ncbi:hypothetical protein DFH06DRAFT_1364649 [Mycena polygramma]|nr:hypothetical protein DFH06DRAFT_1364649 [Mycena polygramma]
MCPKLTDFSMGYSVWFPRDHPTLPLGRWLPPSEQLTSFTAPNVLINGFDARFIFRTAVKASLTVCDIRIDDFPPDDILIPPTLLKDLRSLTLCFRSMCREFWDEITAPELHHLSITSLYYDDEPGSWGHEEFMVFKERSGFILKDLSLRFEYSDVQEMIALLDAEPELERLVLCWSGITEQPYTKIDPLLRKMEAKQGSALWLAKLRTIALEATPDSLAMLQSRCAMQSSNPAGGAPRLSDITLYAELNIDGSEFDPSIVFPREIDALLALGCQVSVELMDYFGGHDFYALSDDSEDDEGSWE